MLSSHKRLHQQDSRDGDARMRDKVILITGASDGIGKATAFDLAKRGARLVLIGRNSDKTNAVADAIAKTAGGTRPQVFLADLSLPSQVHRVAGEVKSKLSRLDVLINNAGAYFDVRTVNEEGFEPTFSLNHLSYFVLTNNLLPLLRQGHAARIVNVASEAHRGVTLDFDDLQGERNFSGFRAYQKSKLANILFSNQLARRLKGEKVTSNSLHPGFVASGFGHNNSSKFSSILKLSQKLFAISPEKGAETSIYLATAQDVTRVSGKYFAKSEVKTPARAALDEKSAARLWEISEALVAEYLI